MRRYRDLKPLPSWRLLERLSIKIIHTTAGKLPTRSRCWMSSCEWYTFWMTVRLVSDLRCCLVNLNNMQCKNSKICQIISPLIHFLLRRLHIPQSLKYLFIYCTYTDRLGLGLKFFFLPIIHMDVCLFWLFADLALAFCLQRAGLINTVCLKMLKT